MKVEKEKCEADTDSFLERKRTDCWLERDARELDGYISTILEMQNFRSPSAGIQSVNSVSSVRKLYYTWPKVDLVMHRISPGTDPLT